KSFRNEITPGNFIFRTREFEQMEIEFFCEPDTSKDWFSAWKKDSMQYLYDIGLPEGSLRFADHPVEKLSHYSDATTDIEYKFPWGYDEMWGIASRTDFDLTQHQNHSGEKLHYQDPVTNEKYIPYVIEPSLGVERLFLAVLADAYEEETLEDGQTRTVLKLHPALAPYKVAVLPLIKKRHREEAHRIQDKLAKRFMTTYDEAGQIGRRYRRQDAVGTPLAVTIDDDTLEKGTYTVRNRDTMEQVTLTEDKLIDYIQNSIDF
ncbi:MAG: glycine--tRNA ligase, partial [Bacillota bacterium]